MGSFAHAFANVVKSLDGKQTALAAASGVPQTTISRLQNGKNPPDVETLRKLCIALPDAEAATLLAAFLQDSVPAGCSHLVEIEIPKESNTRLSEQPTIYRVSHGLRRDVSDAIDHLVQMCRRDLDFANYIVETVRYLDPEWARAADIRSVEEMGSILSKQTSSQKP